MAGIDPLLPLIVFNIYMIVIPLSFQNSEADVIFSDVIDQFPTFKFMSFQNSEAVLIFFDATCIL